GNRRHLLIPPPRNAQAGWHVVSESERRVGWGCKKRSPPWPRFASAFPPHCSLTLAGEGWERPVRRQGVLDDPPSRGMTAASPDPYRHHRALPPLSPLAEGVGEITLRKF